MNKLVVLLYGSTGDLVAKKILPAIMQMTELSEWQESMAILALGRKNFDTLSYLEHIKSSQGQIDEQKLLSSLAYLNMDITSGHDYYVLKNVLKDISGENTKFLHFFALSPSLVGLVSENLVSSGIISKRSQHRVIFEKPFGQNQKSAKLMNKKLWKYFDESQIYRIDHYLGKDTVEQIFNVRFENPLTKQLFEQGIKQIKIFAFEKDGILKRGEYYDQAGATADMVQSHLLQLVSLLTMKRPKCNMCDELVDAKVCALKKVKVCKKCAVFGQYNNYVKEKNVSTKSNTETFVFCDCVASKTPVFLMTGKAMEQKRTSIVVEFENNVLEFMLDKNKIVLDGKDIVVNQENLSPYAKLLSQAAEGDRRNFVRFDEIEKSWAIVDKIKKHKKAMFVYKNNKDILDALPQELKTMFEKYLTK